LSALPFVCLHEIADEKIDYTYSRNLVKQNKYDTISINKREKKAQFYLINFVRCLPISVVARPDPIVADINAR
jgi:hypothetical protein